MESAVVLCTAGYDRTIRFWEALSGICARTIQHPDSQVNRLAISSDKKYMAAAGNPNVRIYEALTNNGNVVQSFEGHTSNVTAVQFQQNNKWAVTASEDGTIKLWDMRARDHQREYQCKTSVNDVMIHPNQGELISCDQKGAVKIWDLTANACSHELLPSESPMRSVSTSADGSLLLGANNHGSVYIWQMEYVATVDGIEPSDWELKPMAKINAHSKYLCRSILSGDGKLVATASSDSTIKIWNIEDLSNVKLERTLSGHQRWVWDCAFSADSEYIVSASSDHTARLWDVSRGETIRQYQGHHKATVCVALNDFGGQ